jgi:hypothetical protein
MEEWLSSRQQRPGEGENPGADRIRGVQEHSASEGAFANKGGTAEV